MVSSSSPTRQQKLQTRLNDLLNGCSDDEFSVAEYLNSALYLHAYNNDSNSYGVDDNDDEEEGLMTELALQLQLQTQACHDDIGRCMVEVGAMVPRLAADVSRIGVGLNGMREDAAALMHLGSKADSNTDDKSIDQATPELQTLSSLHALRENLIEVRSILQAASSWDGTVVSMHELIGAIGDNVDDNSKEGTEPMTNSMESEDTAWLAKAVEALGKLEYGAQALNGTPGNEERANTIAAFRSKIEVLLKPILLHALQMQSMGNTLSGSINVIENKSLGPLQQCVSMYKTLNKLDVLKDEYVKSRPANVHKFWFTFTPSKVITDNSTLKNEIDKSFLEWLPSWYDACLVLISEERRRSVSIFGDQDAPIVTAMVLEECFRPLLSSFSNRLSTFSDALDLICMTYEATLRFLSMAYDQILGSNLIIVEKVFVNVVTPFLPYIRNFVNYEINFSTVMISELQHQIGSVVTKYNDENLQSAVHHVSDLSFKIFPIVQTSIARFEMFNRGCDIVTFISLIDSIISNHVNEISISISTLSAALMRHNYDNFESYDDQDIQILLELLKIAGRFTDSISTFGQYVHERFRSLLTGIDTSSKQDSRDPPDSLSTGEVGFLIARSSLGKNDDKSISDLDIILECKPQQNMLNSFSSLRKLVKVCRDLIFEECFMLPRKWLYTLPDNPKWTENSNESGDIMSNYSILPQSYITHVGEHILALVQVLEPFASNDENLSLAKKAMNDLQTVSKESWIELTSLLGCAVGNDDDIINSIINGKNLPNYVSSPEFDDDEDDDELDEAHKFCNDWLDVVSTAVVGRLIERVLRIKTLSFKGREHLAADLNYIVNVLSALGIMNQPHPLLYHLSHLASLSNDEFEEERSSRKVGTENKMEEVINQFESRFTKIRRQ